MARINLVKGKPAITKRNAGHVISKYIPYVNSAAIIILALKVFNII
jgi:hypothetical protein